LVGYDLPVLIAFLAETVLPFGGLPPLVNISIIDFAMVNILMSKQA
jgi:hypothetical protein